MVAWAVRTVRASNARIAFAGAKPLFGLFATDAGATVVTDFGLASFIDNDRAGAITFFAVEIWQTIGTIFVDIKARETFLALFFGIIAICTI